MPIPASVVALAAASIVAATLGACTHAVQTTSGTDYLSRYEDDPGSAGRTDATIRQAAAVEPTLRLPARFGLARIENGRLTAVPASEADLWLSLAERHRNWGEFVPISPLIVGLAATGVDAAPRRGVAGATEVVNRIRLGAARQHVDAVLVYEVGVRARKENTALAIADLTIIGGLFLPTRTMAAQGVAQALLLDVRNGYPYGTAQAVADLSALSASWGSDKRLSALREEAALRVVENLAPEVEGMFVELAGALPPARD